MRRYTTSLGLLALLGSLGCAATTTYVKSDAALGRVVVYRNGVAYFERTAHLDDDTLHIAVPGDKIDDFLKSLTVVDARTGEPTPVSYPTTRVRGAELAQMEIKLGGPAPHDVKLTYVTEAPSWKSSYRIVLGDKGKVTLLGWAIIDNTSGEDWENVKLAVGSSSALSFRFDLQSVRLVQRDTLEADSPFAMAPPIGGATYDDQSGLHVLGELSDESLQAMKPRESSDNTATSSVTGTVTDGVTKKALADVVVTLSSARGEQVVVTDSAGQYRFAKLAPGSYTVRVENDGYKPSARAVSLKTEQTLRVNDSLRPEAIRPEEIVVVGRAPTIDVSALVGGATRNAPSATRSRPLGSSTSGSGRAAAPATPASPPAPKPMPAPQRSQAANAAPPSADKAPMKIDELAARLRDVSTPIIVEGYAGDGDGDKHAASLERANKMRDELVSRGIAESRVVAVGNGQKPGRGAGVRVVEAGPKAGNKPAGGEPSPASLQPIGASHFDSGLPMTVPRGGSAMVSVLKTPTDGETVYYYDPDSPRGNAVYPFKAVRFQNPTDSVLESGPVTVFGAGRFIGEGMCEAIPAKSMAFVPFALDRQIVIERAPSERDEISRILTVERGVFATEVQHIRQLKLVLHSRAGDPVSMYYRHLVPEGYKLVRSPRSEERLGGAPLFKIDVPANGTVELLLEVAAPRFRSIDIRGPAGMEMVRAYLSSTASLRGPLRARVGELVSQQQEVGAIEQKVETTKETLDEYRRRMAELHAQILTLKAVKTAGPLMKSLEQKLDEVNGRLQKTTVDLVGLQEKLMVTRIKLQDAMAELSLDTEDAPAARSL